MCRGKLISCMIEIHQTPKGHNVGYRKMKQLLQTKFGISVHNGYSNKEYFLYGLLIGMTNSKNLTLYGFIDAWSCKILGIYVHVTNNDPCHIGYYYLQLHKTTQNLLNSSPKEPTIRRLNVIIHLPLLLQHSLDEWKNNYNTFKRRLDKKRARWTNGLVPVPPEAANTLQTSFYPDGAELMRVPPEQPMNFRDITRTRLRRKKVRKQKKKKIKRKE
ncbi:hypothetical protein VP01_1861g7 [Puccinia sorghi]|uniref:Uncharacterized protein n=1 Tax=Puccinia sorghi TaxID=27349 RepID=A0A0L6VFA6_9BASI|nr:hypothetical protein VP01_1861g7 [Puccinia sorghi]